jgi:nucleotide-binding universal stress UspA family protein
MYEKILVPLDGSEVGEAALSNVENLAIKLLPANEVEIILLNVVSDLTFDFLTEQDAAQLAHPENELDQIKTMVKKYLDNVASRLKSKGLKVVIKISEGHAAEEIIKTAQEQKADLIAMSTHGRSGFGRWAMGSITDKVLHESPIPVLTVRARPTR